MADVKVLAIEEECAKLIQEMENTLNQAKKDFKEWDNAEDMHLIDEMKTAIKYMNKMRNIIKKYR